MTEPQLPEEADAADAAEQQTPVEEAAPNAGPQGGDEADDGDLAESAREVPVDDDERR
jgi:hypothetical protein